jgi:3-oxoadipate CoA-transferase alpha subunit
VAKIVCSFPIAKEGYVFKEWYEAGKIGVEVVPQGTLAERIRCAGAGLGGFLTPTGVGTEVADGKQVLNVNGREYLLELPLRGDFALIRADAVDPRGNLTYRKAARNFNAVMATAADTVLVQANREVALGELDPEIIITPGLYVDRYIVGQAAPVARAA